MSLRLSVWRNTVITSDCLWARVVCGERQLSRTEAFQHREKIPRRTIKVLVHVMRVDPKLTCCFRHQLPEADCANVRSRVRIKSALYLDIGAEKRHPIRCRQSSMRNRAITRIAEASIVDSVKDFGAGYYDPVRASVRATCGNRHFRLDWLRAESHETISEFVFYESVFADNENVRTSGASRNDNC